MKLKAVHCSCSRPRELTAAFPCPSQEMRKPLPPPGCKDGWPWEVSLDLWSSPSTGNAGAEEKTSAHLSLAPELQNVVFLRWQWPKQFEAMSRHSKHSNDRMFFTAKERADAGYSKTRKEQTSHAPNEDPVATPDGNIFERESILECLLQQKLDIQAQQKKFEEQERKKEQRLQAMDKEEEIKQLEEFTRAEQGLLSQEKS
eukprot:g28562.t1